MTLLSPKAKANISPSLAMEQRPQRPTRGTTSLQGEEEIAVALQLLHELLVLQEERDPLVLQVLLPAVLLVPGSGPGCEGQASLCARRLGAPRVSLRKGASMWTGYSQGRALHKHPRAPGGTRVLPRMLWSHPAASTSYLT